MTAISRRGLFSILRGSGSGHGHGEFSLDAFYSGRGGAKDASVPVFEVRAGGVATETTSVGVPREDVVSAREAPASPIAIDGVVRIRPYACLAYRSFCSTCSERCPVEGAIVIELGRPRVDETRCDGCGICVHVCPAPINGFDIVPRETNA